MTERGDLHEKLDSLMGKRVFVRISAAAPNPPEDYLMEGVLIKWLYNSTSFRDSHPYELWLKDGHYKNFDWQPGDDTRHFEGEKQETILLTDEEVTRLDLAKSDISSG